LPEYGLPSVSDRYQSGPRKHRVIDGTMGEARRSIGDDIMPSVSP